MTTTSVVKQQTTVAYAKLIRLAQKKSDFTDANAGQSNALSTGAYIGIGVGIGIVVLSLIGIGFWCLLWRRKKKTGAPTAATADSQPQPINHLSMQDSNIGHNAHLYSPLELRTEPTPMTAPNGPSPEDERSFQSPGWQAPTHTEVVQPWAYQNGTEVEARAIPVAELSAKEKDNISNVYNRTN